MLKFRTGLRSTRPESIPGPNDQSVVRTSNPPQLGRSQPASTPIAAPLTLPIFNAERLDNTVTAITARPGSHASSGTLGDNCNPRSCAQSFAKPIVYFTISGTHPPA